MSWSRCVYRILLLVLTIFFDFLIFTHLVVTESQPHEAHAPISVDVKNPRGQMHCSNSVAPTAAVVPPLQLSQAPSLR